MRNNRILRAAGTVVLAVLVGALTVLTHLVIIVGLARYPLETIAVGAAIAAGVTLWVQVGQQRWLAWKASRHAGPPDDETPDHPAEPEDAGENPSGVDLLEAVLSPEDYAELLAIGKAYPQE